jgi:peroxiredoxin
MTEERKVKIGQKAKDFALKDQNSQEIKLSQFGGKRVILSFHPLAWTEVCAKQMKSLEKNKKVLDSLNVIALGISVDTVPSKQAWAKSLDIKNTSLLSDFWPHGEVAKLYGIFREKNGFSERANIIVDESQKIVFFKVYEISQLPDMKEIIDFLKKLK